jgi:hypothetical protein
LVEIERIDKFGYLIELIISLINEIKGLIEEIPKFEADARQNYKNAPLSHCRKCSFPLFPLPEKIKSPSMHNIAPLYGLLPLSVS